MDSFHLKGIHCVRHQRGHAVIVDSAEKPPHSMDVTTGANSTYIKPKLGY